MAKTRPPMPPLRLVNESQAEAADIVNALAARLMGWVALDKSPIGNPTPEQVRHGYIAWSRENTRVYATQPGSPRWSDDHWREWNPAMNDGDALQLLCAYPEITVRAIAGECLYVCDMGETLVRSTEKRFRFALLSMLANLTGVTKTEKQALERLMGHAIELTG